MSKNEFSPRVVKGKKGWYIEFYVDGKRKRKTYGLNRIQNENVREVKAEEICRQLRTGERKINKNKKAGITIEDAIEKALALKEATTREATMHSYRSKAYILLRWLKRKKLHLQDLSDLDKKTVRAFLDYTIVTREVGPSAYNGYIYKIHAVFQTLVDRNYIKKNPFKGFEKRKVPRKLRRCFNNEEKRIVFDAIKKKEPYLLCAVILLYACAIRPSEMRRLKLRNIDLELGVIVMDGTITKNKNDDVVTIPHEFLDYLSECWDEAPSYYYVFGAGFKPDPDRSCGKNQMNKRHREILEHLVKTDQLEDATGLSLYSWKDTGVTELSKKMDIVSIMKHVRHQSLEETKRYIDSLQRVNRDIQEFRFGIMD